LFVVACLLAGTSDTPIPLLRKVRGAARQNLALFAQRNGSTAQTLVPNFSTTTMPCCMLVVVCTVPFGALLYKTRIEVGGGHRNKKQRRHRRNSGFPIRVIEITAPPDIQLQSSQDGRHDRARGGPRHARRPRDGGPALLLPLGRGPAAGRRAGTELRGVWRHGRTGKVACLCARWSDGDVGCRPCAGTGRAPCRSCRGSGRTGRRPAPVRVAVRAQRPLAAVTKAK
jgi:hypothetical protein